MKRFRALLVASAFCVAVFAAPSPAPAMTCMIADPTLDEIVCGTIERVAPHAGFLCTKYRICFG